MKTIIYIVYHCLQNDEKTFEESETETRNNILKLYKNLVSLLYFSVEFNAELFRFDRRFLMIIKASIFFAIENVIVDC